MTLSPDPCLNPNTYDDPSYSDPSYSDPSYSSQTEQPSACPPHLDHRHLQVLSDGSPEFERELLQLFLSDSQGRLDQLKRAIATHNVSQIEHNAHYLRGASANVGAKAIQFYAEQIEQQAQQQGAIAPDLLLELERSLHYIVQWTNRCR